MYNFPRSKDDDAIRDHKRVLCIVSHDNTGNTHLNDDLADLVSEITAQIGIEITKGLVQQEYFGIRCQSARQSDSLTFAS